MFLIDYFTIRFVVLDEAHTYQGFLGMNMANIIRRLIIAAEQAGCSPKRIRFIIASATVGNAREMALKLIGYEEIVLERVVWI